MNLAGINNFCKEYSDLIQIILWGLGVIFIPITIYILNQIKNNSKKIMVTYKAVSTVICPTRIINEITILNNRPSKLNIKRIELTLYDKNNEYKLELYNQIFKVEADDTTTIRLNPVSYYSLNSECVNIKYLLFEKKFYFTVYLTNNKKISPDKKRLFRIRKRLRLSPITLIFEEVAHSPEWDYGFIYTYKNSEKRIGFLNKKIMTCPDNTIDAIKNDIFNTQTVQQLLTAMGCQNIEFKELTSSKTKRPIKIRFLGDNPKYNQQKIYPIEIKREDILSETRISKI